MAVIAKYKIGNSKITIHDDDCVKTPEERQEILRNISKLVAAYLPQGVPNDKPLEFDDAIIDVGPNGDWDDPGTVIYPGRAATA